MSRGRRVSASVRDAIEVLAARGNGPAAIYQALDSEKVNWLGTHPVDVRTIQRLVKEFKGKGGEEPEPWTLAEADPDEAGLILNMIEAMSGSRPGQSWPTRALADWIVRVRKAAPDIPRAWALSLAEVYQARTLQGRDVRYLDLLLAHRLWRQAADEKLFYQVVRCSRPLLGEPDALRWVLTDLDVLTTYEGPEGTVVIFDEELLTGPCDHNPHILRFYN